MIDPVKRRSRKPHMGELSPMVTLAKGHSEACLPADRKTGRYALISASISRFSALAPQAYRLLDRFNFRVARCSLRLSNPWWTSEVPHQT
jgi:hypothetical protein